jgi:5-methyltetrahydrofolate--homocysteine methyltransferase
VFNIMLNSTVLSKNMEISKMTQSLQTILANKNKSVTIHRDGPTIMIGERINPTGRKVVLQALQAGNFELVRQDAIAQVAAGAAVLDVNAGVPGADEVTLLSQVMEEVMSVVDVPLCIDTANPTALEAALKLYAGKALINSVNGEEKSLKTVLPLAKEYGTAIIGLCMDDDGIPPPLKSGSPWPIKSLHGQPNSISQWRILSLIRWQ